MPGNFGSRSRVDPQTSAAANATALIETAEKLLEAAKDSHDLQITGRLIQNAAAQAHRIPMSLEASDPRAIELCTKLAQSLAVYALHTELQLGKSEGDKLRESIPGIVGVGYLLAMAIPAPCHLESVHAFCRAAPGLIGRSGCYGESLKALASPSINSFDSHDNNDNRFLSLTILVATLQALGSKPYEAQMTLARIQRPTSEVEPILRSTVQDIGGIQDSPKAAQKLLRWYLERLT